MATGIVNTLRQIGTATGVAICGALFTGAASSHVHTALDGAAPAARITALADAVSSGAGARVAAGLPAAQRETVAQVARAATAEAIHTILWVGGAVAMIGAVVCFLLLVQNRPVQSASERTERDSLARTPS